MAANREKAAKKRVREKATGREASGQESNPPAKKAKRAEDESSPMQHETERAAGSIDPDFALRDAQLLADWMAQKTRQWFPNLTDIELRDMYLPSTHPLCTRDHCPALIPDLHRCLHPLLTHITGESIIDTSGLGFTGQRTLERLPQFLDLACADYLGPGTATRVTHVEKQPAEKSAPHTLVVCSSAARATDVLRSLRGAYVNAPGAAGPPRPPIAVMVSAIQFALSALHGSNLYRDNWLQFAKHHKLKEQAAFLKNVKMHFGAGTPERIGKLLEMGKQQSTSPHRKTAQ